MRDFIDVARTTYINICDTLSNVLRNYDNVQLAYAYEGAGNHNLDRKLDNSEEKSLRGERSNLSFMARSDKRGGGKGGGRLHECSNNVWVMKGGQTIKVNKNDKPKGMSLKQYIMSVAGVNEKVASIALKNHN